MDTQTRTRTRVAPSPFFPTDEIEAAGRSRPVASRSSLEMWVMLSVAYIVSLSRYL